MRRTKIPEFFCTAARKVEPVGGDCIRIYHSIEKNGVWEDLFTVVIPIASLMVTARFVMDSAAEIFRENQMPKEAHHRAH